MRTGMRRGLAVAAMGLGWLCLAAPALWGQGKAAGKEASERGFVPTGSYQLSEIETVNSKNGNVTLVVPLASLPPGRGGNPGFELTLNYNSNLRDFLVQHEWNSERTLPGDPYYLETHRIGEAFGSPGWRYNYDYRVDVQDRNQHRRGHYPQYCDGLPLTPGGGDDFIDKHWYRYQLRMVFPDGSVHEFRPVGEDDRYGDSYFRILPTGWKMKDRGHCKAGITGWTAPAANTTVSYYSTDGTYLRLDFEADSPSDASETRINIFKWQDNPWTLTFPDGRQVKGLGLMANRFLDPNDSDANAVTISRLLDDGDPYDLIRDEAGRTIRIDPGENQQPDPNRQTIRRKGADGEELTWTVEWGETRVNRTYAIKKIRHDESGSPTQTTNTEDTIGYIAGNLRMVTRIVLPSELGGLDYEFTYNGTESNPSGAAYAPHSRGLGELRTATMPWGAKATYTYVQDYEATEAASMVHKAQAAAENAITAKSLSYATGFGTETLTENWDYQIAPNSQAIITTPGGGKTRETYGRNAAFSGLLAKVEYCEEATIPLGGPNCLDSKLSRVMEREWAYNIPAIGSPGITRASMLRANPYVKSEYRTEQGTADKTGVVDYTYDKNGNLTRADEYDWVNYTAVHDSSGNPTTSRGTRLRTTAHTYQAATPTATNTATPDDDAYYDPDSPRRLRLRATTEVREGGGTKRSRRQFSYDSRGNLTREKIGKSNASGVVSGTLTSANSFTISHTYDSHGHSNRTSTTDGEGNVTRWTYGAIADSGSPSKDRLYPTRVVEASGAGVARTMTYGYDFHTGQVTSSTDADNGVSTLTELDDVGRPILVKAASGKSEERRTQSWYCDEKRRMIERSDLSGRAGSGQLVTVTDYDGLGRVRLARSYEGDQPSLPTGSNRNAHCSSYDSETAGIKVETHYLRSGTSSYTISSSPYRGATAPTMTGWTRIKLDHLGRVVQAGLFSGASKPSTSATPTLGKTTTAYDGEYTTVTDPAGKTRRSKRDGLGRLVRVDEPDSSANLGTTGSPNQKTSYSYNALGNLTRVTQGSQTRTFAYDSLSRLTSTSNPESGTIAYSYDNNGNLTQRTDARSVVTAYTYDGLDRLTRRSYSYTGSDTAVSLETTRVDYAYDSCGSYTRGRLCSVTAKKGATQVSRTAYNRYDALGRVLESTQTTGGQPYTMAYAYDRAGNLIRQRYPSDRVVDYVYDGAGRIAGAKTGIDGWYAGGTGTNAVDYEPHGGVKQLLLGNGLWEQRRYNARLQPTQIGLGTAKTASGTALGTTQSGLLLLDYSYGTASNNGNVLSQRIRAGTLNQNQTYTYDSLNRLKTAGETGSAAAWSQTYTYDRYGNRRVTTGASHGSNQALTPQSTADIDTATNRLAGTKGVNLTVAYDAAGNIKADWAGRSFKYDGDHRLVAFDTTGTDSDTTYSYDGEGRRVRKVVGGASGITTTYVYNVGGQLLAEFGGTAPEAGGTRYLTPDHLGSTRVVTGEDQSVLSRHDYLPFGEEIGTTYGGRSSVSGYTPSRTDGPTQKFTGKERDTESQLDYFGARYFGGAAGRFTSADAPFADQRASDPQSWNLYSYTRNNPLRYVDRTGNVLESPWDILNVGIGVVSAGVNISKGNYLDAAVDLAGVVVDVAATALPGVPGGAATAIRVSRAGRAVVRAVNKVDNAADVATSVNKVDTAASAAKGAGKAASKGRSWSTVRRNYWKQYGKDGKAPTRRVQVRDRKTGELREINQTKELHHKKPRREGGTDDESNLQPAWPDEHERLDRHRHTGYDVTRVIGEN